MTHLKMTKNHLHQAFRLSPIALALMATSVVAAEENTADDQSKKGLDFERIVVTGVTKNQSVMQSSVSVSSLSAEQFQVATPRTSVELLRSIPGIRAESTGGEGNANIAVRGLPVAAGGAKFLQLQEDGLPIMQFGDIAFGTADIFLRTDASIAHVEAIRGGSASTTSSNSPGGIVNFISNTGEFEGGSIATTFGLDYASFRTDFSYGGEIDSDWSFHVGGFYRSGDGARDVGYTANEGGQIKANLTRHLDKGHVRVYFKHLNDKAIAYLPMPMRSDGSSLANFDSISDTPHSVYLQQTRRTNAFGQITQGNVHDGMNPEVTSIGFELEYELAGGWQLEERFRYSDTSGSFNAPFPAEVGNAQAMAVSIAGDGASLSYANGPNQGSVYSGTDAMRIHTFDVTMDNFNSWVNDIALSKAFGGIDWRAGLYTANQKIEMTWMWNSYLMELAGDDAALLNVSAADGSAYSDNGLYAYGTPFWGNCCQRYYDTEYDILAPYLSASTSFGDWTLDASLRYDSGDATGRYASNQTQSVDMNGNGVIDIPEQQVAVIDLANASPVDYDWSYVSYSIGANYQLDKDLALFGRLSRGGRANADRLLFGKVRADGSVAEADAVDMVNQAEFGAKWRYDNLSLFATGFFAKTEEQNFEATTQQFFDRTYEAKGIELEAAMYVGDFEWRGSVTWTDAEITEDALNPDLVGKTPRRQADFIYSFIGQYHLENTTLGVSLVGSSDAYAQDINDLTFDAYTQVNLFANYVINDQWSVNVNVNNAFDAVGITEAEEGSIPSNDIIRARTVNARTTSLTVRYQF